MVISVFSGLLFCFSQPSLSQQSKQPAVFFPLSIIALLCTLLTTRSPAQRRLWNFVSTLRFPIVIDISLSTSWLNRHEDYMYGGPFQIVGPIESGMSIIHLMPPSATNEVVSTQGSFAHTLLHCLARLTPWKILPQRYLLLFSSWQSRRQPWPKNLQR